MLPLCSGSSWKCCVPQHMAASPTLQGVGAPNRLLMSNNLVTLRLGIHVQPKARQLRLGPSPTHPDHLLIAVRAPAADGRATREAMQRLAKVLALPVASIALVTGTRSRLKVVAISCSSQDEVNRIERAWQALLAGSHSE